MKKVLILGLLACEFITATGTKVQATPTAFCFYGGKAKNGEAWIRCHNFSSLAECQEMDSSACKLVYQFQKKNLGDDELNNYHSNAQIAGVSTAPGRVSHKETECVYGSMAELSGNPPKPGDSKFFLCHHLTKKEYETISCKNTCNLPDCFSRYYLSNIDLDVNKLKTYKAKAQIAGISIQKVPEMYS